jgi:hypothetical protein
MLPVVDLLGFIPIPATSDIQRTADIIFFTNKQTHKMADYGIKVTRDGYAITSTEPTEYVFNSAYSSVKIQAQYTGTLTVSAGGTSTASITHGLSFIPLFLFFTELSPSSGKWFFGQITNTAGGDTDAGDCEIVSYADGSGDIVGTYADSTYIKLQVKNNGATSKNVKYRVMVFADSGQ